MGIRTHHASHKDDGGKDFEPYETCMRSDSTDRVWRHRFFVLLTCWIFTFILSMSWMISVQSTSNHSICQKSNVHGKSHSPADAHVVYEDREIMNDHGNSPFQGPPGAELDKAWYDLLQGTLIRVSKEELEAANQPSIPLKGGGYGVGLGVSHSLHCLRRIHRYVHKSYYHTAKDEDWAELEYHVDHCIEGLRQAVMCQVDTTLYPLVWESDFKLQPAVLRPHARSCVNFNLLHEWMLGRAASMDDLVRPPDSFFDDS